MSNAGISEIYETARERIVNSALGKALGLTNDSEILDVAVTIEGVVDNGAWNSSISTFGTSVDIPKGYHNGSGKVTGPSLVLVGLSEDLQPRLAYTIPTASVTIPSTYNGKKGFVICTTGTRAEDGETFSFTNGGINIENAYIEDKTTTSGNPIVVYYGTLKTGTISVTGTKSGHESAARVLVLAIV